MKKTLLLVAAAFAFVACSNDETILQAQPEAIGFDNAFIENSTRSGYDPSFTGTKIFSDFAVYGFVEGAVLFDGTQVSKDITNGDLKSDWKYAGTQYWIAGAKYNFNAVAPKTGGGWTKTGATKDATTLSFTNDGETDLLYAYATAEGKAESNNAVAFTFRHVLSKVKFTFKNDYNATNATIRVKNVKITDAYKTGSVVLSDVSTWSSQAGTLELAFGNAAVTSANTEEAFGYSKSVESYNELLLIPGAGPTVVDGKKTYTVTFTVDLLVSGTLVKSYTHTINAAFTPEAGNSYNLTATINAENIDPEHKQEPIEFTVNTLPGWGTTNNQNI